nr:reverse transcriptase domain-containing protein [Tanacetum cinerariifolium]
GLPRSIEGNVTASKPQTLEEVITITQRLMDQGKGLAFWFLRFGSCVLSPAICTLYFASKLVVFYFKARCIFLQDTLRFASRYAAFCFKTSCVLLQDPCVLSQDSCVLSHGGTAFCLVLKTLSAIW